jgi:GNAT superfamily N-acetyltransferase
MVPSAALKISIQPLNYSDIPNCASRTRAVFAVDPHTIVKELGRDGYDMYAISTSSLLGGLERQNQIHVKAVDESTGQVIGHAGWVFRNVDQELVPYRAPSDEKPAEDEKPTAQENGAKEKEKEKEKEHREKDSIDRLHEMEDADMQHWLNNIIPSTTPCMIILGLTVSPEYQSRGVGTALLSHGNAIADKLGLEIHVHSSHQAYEAYRKSAFEAVRVLDVDLDEYAPRPPQAGEPVMEGGGDGKWGHYIIRYMERKPKSS